MKNLLQCLLLAALCVCGRCGMAGADIGDSFCFVMNAGPQTGPGDSTHENERRLQRLPADFVDEVNPMVPERMGPIASYD